MKWEHNQRVHVTDMDGYEDAIAAVEQLAAQEQHARAAGRQSAIDALTDHTRSFRTPVPHRYDRNQFTGALDAPGDVDSTGFGKGCIV